MKVDGFARALGMAAAPAVEVTGLETSVNELDEAIAAMNQSLEATKTEMSTEIATVQTSLDAEIEGVKTDLRNHSSQASSTMAYNLERAMTYTDNQLHNANIVSSTAVNNIVKLTQAEYDALTEKDGATLYLIIS